MFKVGQDVVIKRSERIYYSPPYDGVVTAVSDYSYYITLSNGERIKAHNSELEEADFPSLGRMAEILRNNGYTVLENS